MLLLDANTGSGYWDGVKIITGSAGNIEVAASFVDINKSTNAVTVQPPIFSNPTTATSTTIVSAPADGFLRNVKNITIANVAATANLVEVVVNRYIDSRLIRVNLAANETLIMGEDGQWSYYAENGALQKPTSQLVTQDNLGITGSLAETMPRHLISAVNTAALTSGTLFLQAIYLRAGQVISNISFHSATTAGATLTNQIFGLYDGATLGLLATTTNDGATAWAANTLKTLALTAPYTVQTTGVYYLGIMVAATTVPTLAGAVAQVNSALHGQAPKLHGNSTTALTTALPATAAAITAGTTSVWGCVK